jgi:hypothetical protein
MTFKFDMSRVEIEVAQQKQAIARARIAAGEITFIIADDPEDLRRLPLSAVRQ